MPEQDQASKTEDPTAKRLEKGREEGQVAVSQEIKSWGVLFAATIAIAFLSDGAIIGIRDAVLPFVVFPHALALEPANLQQAFGYLILNVGWAIAPIIGVIVVFALAANIAQIGLIWAPKKIAPKLEKVSPIKGFTRIFGVTTLVEFVKGMIKVTTVAAVGFGLALTVLGDVQLLPSMPFSDTAQRIDTLAFLLFGGTVAVMALVAALDYAYQRHTHLKQMRMTKQEVRDEHKQSEGDPHVKARIRKLRTDRARQRMMAAVPEADVVITNPTHYAVALTYDIQSMRAPKLVAKGVDHVAQTIREVAEEHDVAVVENPPLARTLYAGVEIDEEIPPEHYQAVAQVISYVMKMKGRTL